jgi:predicted metal-binding membrane protein
VQPRTAAERIALRSRTITIASLAILTLLAWAYLLSGAGMGAMAGMVAMAPGWPLIFAMWAAMMVAMMLPSAAPAILLYARVHRHSAGISGAPPTGTFLGGYLFCWLAFSAIAATLHQALEGDAFANPHAAAALLVGAGLYQLSPLKNACLAHCRSPAEFLTRHYRPGLSGALRLGLLHGAFCVGCCWLLMALLFVGGVMNLSWVAVLTLLVAAEKLLPAGRIVALIAGLAFIGWGITLLV